MDFPFRGYYAFLFNVKLAYRCGARLSHPAARVNRLEDSLSLGGKGARIIECSEFPSTTDEVYCLTGRHAMHAAALLFIVRIVRGRST